MVGIFFYCCFEVLDVFFQIWQERGFYIFMPGCFGPYGFAAVGIIYFCFPVFADKQRNYRAAGFGGDGEGGIGKICFFAEKFYFKRVSFVIAVAHHADDFAIA